ncbi:MAG: GGDEF domain-containing protein [Thermodesulfobacteriota bacterium]
MPTPPPDPLDVQSREVLSRELDSLRRAVLARHPGLAPDLESNESLLALLRLVPGLSLDQWPHLSEKLGLKDWLAVPLRGDDAPFLEQLGRTLEDLAFQTEHDPLTGLPNRRAFDRTMDRELERARRAGISLSVAVLDLDNFKRLNDTHGHPCGDEALVQTARILLTGIRRYDMAARIGGEEFALVFPETGMTRASLILERILESLRQVRLGCAGIHVRLTASVGLACTKGRGERSPADLMEAADKALYQAKGEGKDRVVAAPLLDLAAPAKATLVEASEKRFLFTGS